MKLPAAWIAEARSDAAAARVLRDAGADNCQVVAKCQQSVEKAVKSLVEAMNALGLLTMAVGSGHDVSGFVSALMRAMDAAPKNRRSWKSEFARCFPDHTRVSIKELDALVPRYPAKGALAARNTEYPFQATSTDWRAPAEKDVFSSGDVKRYLAASERVTGRASKILSALDRAFPGVMT